jgi:HEAT repeat protein
MDLLRIIYLIANVLAAISMSGTILVIVVHIVRARRERRRQDERLRLSRDILRYLQNPVGDEAVVARMREDYGLAAGLVQELAELITGGQRLLLLTLARSADLDRWLIAELHAHRASRRLAAAEALGLFGSPAAVAALKHALDDRDNDVRIGAALALADLDALPPLATLMEKLALGRRYRPFMLRRLFATIVGKHLEELVAVAEGRLGAASARPYAIEAIGASGHLELADRLAALMSDADPTVRAAVLAAIATLGRSPVPDAVATGLADPASEVRAQAVLAARRLERFDLGARVAALANDDSWWVRLQASGCLAAFQEASVDRLRARGEVPAEETRRLAERGDARRLIPGTQ